MPFLFAVWAATGRAPGLLAHRCIAGRRFFVLPGLGGELRSGHRAVLNGLQDVVLTLLFELQSHARIGFRGRIGVPEESLDRAAVLHGDDIASVIPANLVRAGREALSVHREAERDVDVD